MRASVNAAVRASRIKQSVHANCWCVQPVNAASTGPCCQSVRVPFMTQKKMFDHEGYSMLNKIQQIKIAGDWLATTSLKLFIVTLFWKPEKRLTCRVRTRRGCGFWRNWDPAACRPRVLRSGWDPGRGWAGNGSGSTQPVLRFDTWELKTQTGQKQQWEQLHQKGNCCLVVSDWRKNDQQPENKFCARCFCVLVIILQHTCTVWKAAIFLTELCVKGHENQMIVGNKFLCKQKVVRTCSALHGLIIILIDVWRSSHSGSNLPFAQHIHRAGCIKSLILQTQKIAKDLLTPTTRLHKSSGTHWMFSTSLLLTAIKFDLTWTQHFRLMVNCWRLKLHLPCGGTTQSAKSSIHLPTFITKSTIWRILNNISYVCAEELDWRVLWRTLQNETLSSLIHAGGYEEDLVLTSTRQLSNRRSREASQPVSHQANRCLKSHFPTAN